MILVERLAYVTPIKVSRHSADPTFQVPGLMIEVSGLELPQHSALNAQVFSFSHAIARWETSGLNFRSTWLNQRCR